MRYCLAAIVLMATTAPAYAMTYQLVAQWTEGTNRFCKYQNGEVRNVGIRICPLTIQG